MNKLEYLTRLRNYLEKYGLPEDDINDALNYYEEVFLEAGFGKDSETAQSLGSPEEIAMGILRESGIHIGETGDFPVNLNKKQDNYTDCGKQSDQRFYEQNKKQAASNTILKIIIAVLTFPIWLPILITIVALLFTFIVVIFVLLIAVVASGIGILFGGFAVLIEAPPLGIMCIGGGLVLTGISFLILRGLFRWIAPGCVSLIRKFVAWLGSLFRKRGENV